MCSPRASRQPGATPAGRRPTARVTTKGPSRASSCEGQSLCLALGGCTVLYHLENISSLSQEAALEVSVLHPTPATLRLLTGTDASCPGPDAGLGRRDPCGVWRQPLTGQAASGSCKHAHSDTWTIYSTTRQCHRAGTPPVNRRAAKHTISHTTPVGNPERHTGTQSRVR